MGYSSLKNILFGLCVSSAAFGISVAIIGSWAIYVKSHSLEELYPGAENRSKSSPEVSNVSKDIWSNLKTSWKHNQFKDIAMSGFTILTGLTQFEVAVIILYRLGQNDSANILAKRFILGGAILICVLFVCDISTGSSEQLNISPKLKTLNLGFSQSSSLTALISFGTNLFTFWLAVDIIFLFMSISLTCAFMKIYNSVSSELLTIAVR